MEQFILAEMLFYKHSVGLLLEWLYNTSEFIIKSAAQGGWHELQQVRYMIININWNIPF